MDECYDVVGIGCCAFDIIVEAERLPGADEKVPMRRLRTQGGGLVATALVAVARLGGKCVYLGALGDDYFAQFCVDEFEKEGVDTGLIRRVPGSSVLTAVVVAQPATGTRMIFWTNEGAPAFSPDDVPEEIIRKTRVLHVDSFQPDAALKAADIARSAGVPVTMDLEFGGPKADSFLSLGDYVIVPLAFTRRRYGTDDMEEAARALFEEIAPLGGRAAVVTGGAGGSYAVRKGRSLHQPAYRVEVVDTTGCGDVFHGAFALGVARDWDLERIMPFAAATAALKCRRLGGRAGIPTEPEVREFLRSAEPIT